MLIWMALATGLRWAGAADPAWLIAGAPAGSVPPDRDERLRQAIELSASRNHQVFRDVAGNIDAWGLNPQGQLDFPASSEIAAVSAGRQHTLLLTKEGEVLACGWNASGQTTIPGNLRSGALAVAAGDFHSAALTAEGGVRVWGFGDYGQTLVPPEANAGIQAIAAGGNHMLALTSRGKVLAWGWNLYGQCNVPTAATAGVASIAAGEFHSVALKRDGSVVVWGRNQHGQRDVPPEAGIDVVAIASGDSHLLALKDDGTVLAWGDGGEGQTTVPTVAQGETLRIAAGGKASFFKVAEPQISVEQPAGEARAAGGEGGTIGPILAGSGASLTFQILNVGEADLLEIEATLDGAAAFSISTAPPATVAAGASGECVVGFESAVSGTFDSTLTISSNAPDQPVYTLTLSAEALSTADDSDEDGFNDWMEHLLRDLGFDRAVDQSDQAEELLAKANEAGLFTEAQFQALSVPNPVIARDPASGGFTLTLGVRKSEDLETFEPLALEPEDVSVSSEGEIEVGIESTEDAAFFRVEVGE